MYQITYTLNPNTKHETFKEGEIEEGSEGLEISVNTTLIVITATGRNKAAAEFFYSQAKHIQPADLNHFR